MRWLCKNVVGSQWAQYYWAFVSHVLCFPCTFQLLLSASNLHLCWGTSFSTDIYVLWHVSYCLYFMTVPWLSQHYLFNCTHLYATCNKLHSKMCSPKHSNQKWKQKLFVLACIASTNVKDVPCIHARFPRCKNNKTRKWNAFPCYAFEWISYPSTLTNKNTKLLEAVC